MAQLMSSPLGENLVLGRWKLVMMLLRWSCMIEMLDSVMWVLGFKE